MLSISAIAWSTPIWKWMIMSGTIFLFCVLSLWSYWRNMSMACLLRVGRFYPGKRRRSCGLMLTRRMCCLKSQPRARVKLTLSKRKIWEKQPQSWIKDFVNFATSMLDSFTRSVQSIQIAAKNTSSRSGHIWLHWNQREKMAKRKVTQTYTNWRRSDCIASSSWQP